MILITGATGFIGQVLLKELLRQGSPVRCTVRRKEISCSFLEHHRNCTQIRTDLLDPSQLAAACQGVKTVYHCAGYAHAFGNKDPNLHWRVNCVGTRNLVEAAATAGVQSFVFLSTVKAMAEPGAICVDEDWPGIPSTPYGQAKRAAEEAVLAAGCNSGMRTVILRLAMVYGPGNGGNLARMAALIQRGLFPPLPETGNRRSLVHVDDVTEVIQRVVRDQRTAGRTYIIAEPLAYSGRQIYEILCRSLGKKPYPWAVPAVILRMLGSFGDFIGRTVGNPFPFNGEVVDRLIDSACYSASRIEHELDWRAKRSFGELSTLQPASQVRANCHL